MSTIEGVNGGNVIDEIGVVSKIYTGISKSGTELVIPIIRLAFANLRQAFNTAPILHYFDSKYSICT